MGARVAVLDPEGKFATVDATDVENLPSGARVLTRAEVKARELDEAYAKKSLGEKATSLVSMAGPVPVAVRAAVKALQGNDSEMAPTLPPELSAYYHGVSEGMTGGLAEVGLKEALSIAAGKQAAHAFGQTQMDAAEAHPGFATAGTAAGLIGGVVAGGSGAALGKAGAAIPGVGIGMLGEAVEQGTGRLLAGVASRGVMGRAVATGTSLAARGAAEGALYGAAQSFSDDMLQDHDIAGEKLFAAAGAGALGGALAGGALGTSGSLIKSGVTKAADAVGSRLSRVLKPAEEAATGVAKASEGAAAKVEEGAKDLLTTVREKITDEGARGLAHESAWRATGGAKKFAAEANKYLPNGTADVGEAMLRHGVIDKEQGWIQAAMKGTPAAIAERIEAPLATVGQRLGEITSNSGASVPARKIVGMIDDVLEPLRGKAGFENIMGGVESYKASLFEKLGVPQMSAEVASMPPEIQKKVMDALYDKASVKVQDLLAQRKALDELVYREGQPLTASARIEELRSVRGKMEDVIASALDEASGKVPGQLKSEYLALKKDYQALRIAQKASEDAATRGSANRTFSLTDKIIGATTGAAGGLVGGPVGGFITGQGTAFISKIVRERGDAAAAVLLNRVADMKLVSQMMARVDDQLARSSKGLLAAPKTIEAPASKGASVERAQGIMKRVAEAQSNPEQYANRLMQQTESLSQTAPKVAGAFTQTALRAAEFLASKLPASAQPDPFDPGKPQRISAADAARLCRYADYADEPMKFYQEVERGKLTREGVEAAKYFTPKMFAELQMRTADALADLTSRGIKPPYAQRERLGLLLDFPAVASQRPEHMILLQANVQAPPPSGNMPAGKGAAPAPPKRPLQMKTQQSALDRLEAK